MASIHTQPVDELLSVLGKARKIVARLELLAPTEDTLNVRKY